MKVLWATVKGLLIGLGVIFLLGLLMVAAAGPMLKAKAACGAVHGHFVDVYYGPDECWSADGTHRLFPEGF